MLAGIGVTAFGVGTIPADLVPLPAGSLPPLSSAEYLLMQNPNRGTPIVNALADLLRTAAPFVLARLEEDQRNVMSGLRLPPAG